MTQLGYQKDMFFILKMLFIVSLEDQTGSFRGIFPLVIVGHHTRKVKPTHYMFWQKSWHHTLHNDDIRPSLDMPQNPIILKYLWPGDCGA